MQIDDPQFFAYTYMPCRGVFSSWVANMRGFLATVSGNFLKTRGMKENESGELSNREREKVGKGKLDMIKKYRG